MLSASIFWHHISAHMHLLFFELWSSSLLYTYSHPFKRLYSSESSSQHETSIIVRIEFTTWNVYNSQNRVHNWWRNWWCRICLLFCTTKVCTKSYALLIWHFDCWYLFVKLRFLFPSCFRVGSFLVLCLWNTIDSLVIQAGVGIYSFVVVFTNVRLCMKKLFFLSNLLVHFFILMMNAYTHLEYACVPICASMNHFLICVSFAHFSNAVLSCRRTYAFLSYNQIGLLMKKYYC